MIGKIKAAYKKAQAKATSQVEFGQQAELAKRELHGFDWDQSTGGRTAEFQKGHTRSDEPPW